METNFLNLITLIIMGVTFLALAALSSRNFFRYIKEQRGCKFKEVMEMAGIAKGVKITCRAIFTAAYLILVIPLDLSAMIYGVVIIAAMWVPLLLIYLAPLVAVISYTLAAALYQMIRNVLIEIWEDILTFNDVWLALKKRFAK